MKMAMAKWSRSWKKKTPNQTKLKQGERKDAVKEKFGERCGEGGSGGGGGCWKGGGWLRRGGGGPRAPSKAGDVLAEGSRGRSAERSEHTRPSLIVVLQTDITRSGADPAYCRRQHRVPPPQREAAKTSGGSSEDGKFGAGDQPDYVNFFT